MTDNIEIKPKWSTIVVLLAGFLGMLAMSYACALDWIIKINENANWMINVVYHPIAGFLSIITASIFLILFIERLKPGTIPSIIQYLKRSWIVVFGSIMIILAGLALSIFNSFMLIVETSVRGYPDLVLVTVHLLLSLTVGIALTLLLLYSILIRYTKNPEKWQRFIVFNIILTLVILMTLVILARQYGLLSLI